MPATNIFTLYLGKQTAQGTLATAPVWAANVRSADLAPTATRNRIEETGLGRDAGDFETSLIAVTGGAELYFRPKIGAYVLYGVLGTKAVTGAGPYVHELTPADDQPFFTVWRNWGNALYERFEDCKITACNITAQNGQSLRMQLTIMGTNYTRVASIPVGSTLDASPLVRYPGVAVTTGGVLNHAVQEYTLSIAANQNAQQTDKITYSYIEPGARTIGLNQTEVYTNRNLYDEIYYGGAGNTTPGLNVFRRTFNAVHVDSEGDTRLEIDVPEHALQTAPLTPTTSAEIARYQVTGGAERPDTGSIITATVTNDVATY